MSEGLHVSKGAEDTLLAASPPIDYLDMQCLALQT